MEKDTAQALPLEIVSVHGSGTLLMGAKIIFFCRREERMAAALTDYYDHR